LRAHASTTSRHCLRRDREHCEIHRAFDGLDIRCARESFDGGRVGIDGIDGALEPSSEEVANNGAPDVELATSRADHSDRSGFENSGDAVHAGRPLALVDRLE